MFDISTFEWFTPKVKVPTVISAKPFTLDCPVQSNWEDSENRLLVIIQEVATADLKERALCGSKYGYDLANTFDFAYRDARLYDRVGKNKFSYAFVNWQAFPTYNLKSRAQLQAAQSAFKERVLKVIKELDPTHILFMGDDISVAFKPDFDPNTRGWVEDIEINGKQYTCCSTLDLSLITSRSSFNDSEDDDDEEEAGRDMFASSGLIETIIRHVRNMYLGYNPHQIEVKVKYKLLDSVQQVKSMVETLKAAPYFAFDTETANLNRIDNELLVMQFASPEEDFTYIVPFLHKDSTFSTKELKQIRKLIYCLFCDDSIDPFGNTKYIVGQNLQFDITQIREQLKIPYITRPTWDLMNGEYLLDENQGFLDGFAGASAKAYSLAAISLRYGCDAFLAKDGFNKADRANISATSLSDKTFLDYCALDCLIPLAVHKEQLKRAEVTKYDKYKNLCLIQQSSNQHAVANMEHRGVLLDIPYLEGLLKKGSTLDKLVTEATRDLSHSKGVQKANVILQEAMGLSNDSLFADIVEDTPDNLFNPAKAEHVQVLFQDVLELEPVGGYQKKDRDNGKPAYKINKAFQQAHRFVFEVSLFSRLSKLKKMKSAYVQAFLKWVKNTADGALTGRLRPNFGFVYVVTGRSNSSKPSLQQTPSRGKESKILKRAFIAPAGHLRLATDYSANEVRFAANIAHDHTMAHAFIVARQLRKAMWKMDAREKRIIREMKRRGIPIPDLTEDKKG